PSRNINDAQLTNPFPTCAYPCGKARANRPKILHGSGFLSKRHRLFDFESRLSAIEKFCPCVTAAPGGPLTSDNGDPMINDGVKPEVKKQGALRHPMRGPGVALWVGRNGPPAVSAR